MKEGWQGGGGTGGGGVSRVPPPEGFLFSGGRINWLL